MIISNNKVISEIHTKEKEIVTKVSNGKVVFDKSLDMTKLLAYYNAAGRTNQDVDRATWKDLTGNGYDLRLNGFAFTPGSGWEDGALVFDGIDDYCQSILSFPAFIDKNYTLVFDLDVREFTVDNSGIISKSYVYLFNRDGAFRWFNVNGNALLDFAKRTVPLIALTNNKAYFSDGFRVVNANAITAADISAPLAIGIRGATYTAMTLRSLSVWSGINYNYEQCVNIYNRMKNNTLI